MPRKKEIHEMRQKLREEKPAEHDCCQPRVDETITRIDVPEALFNKIFQRPKKLILTQTLKSALISLCVVLALAIITAIYWNSADTKLVQLDATVKSESAKIKKGFKAVDARFEILEYRVRSLERQVFEKPEPRDDRAILPEPQN